MMTRRFGQCPQKIFAALQVKDADSTWQKLGNHQAVLEGVG